VRLSNKTVIVTGAAHGIGRAFSEKLAAEGANVALLDIDGPRNREVAQGIVDAGGSAMALETDVQDFAAFERAAAAVAGRFGGVTSLVNYAGMLNIIPITRCNFEHIPEEEWDHCFRLTVKGTWYGCKAVVPYIRKSGGGSIVNIGSSTVFISVPQRVHYVAAKSALIGYTRTLARELGGDGIRVNLLCPGNTLSDEDPDPATVALRAASAKRRCLPRVELPADLVGTLTYLVSDDSAFMTGQIMVIDGGVACH